MSVSIITAMRFTIDNKHLISEKNYVEKSLLKMFLTEYEVLVG